MGGRNINHGVTDSAGADASRNTQIMALGQLSFLAAYCPLHRQFPTSSLARLFIPAINHDCVRFFKNEDGAISAALIWARLSDEVSERMLFDQVPPTEKEWASGHNLWFLDILAPFGHGRQVARIIARAPPEGPFYFARLGKDGLPRKVVQGDASQRRGRKVTSYFIKPGQGS